MREHLENMAKFEENLRKEQERTKAALREKLEARRKKKKDAELQKIKAAAKVETEAAEQKEREEMTALQRQGAERLKASTPATPMAPSDTRQKKTGNDHFDTIDSVCSSFLSWLSRFYFQKNSLPPKAYSHHLHMPNL